MGNVDQTAVAVITPAEAKAKALAVLSQHPGAVSFVRPEDLDTAALYLPVVSYILPDKSDFYEPIPGIGIMARPPLVNLICEKAGINILRTETGKRGEYIWTAHCFGEKRQPDGTMRGGDASYEFDAEKRAELDAINQPGKYGTEIAKRKHLLETARFGEQRAVTGAQFALIHKLAHVARSFRTADELAKGMMVLRIDRNVDGLLRDPATRKTAIEIALGAKTAVFGRTETRDVTPGPAQIEAPPSPEPEPEAPDPFDGLTATAPVGEAEDEEDARDDLRDKLKTWLLDDAIKAHKPKQGTAKAGDAIAALLANGDATLEDLQGMVKRCTELRARYDAARKGGAR